MRVIFLQKTTDAQGGSKASLRNTLKALSQVPGVELELCGEATGPLSEFAMEQGIRFHIAPFPRWRNLTDRLRFAGTMKRFAQVLGRADWIISNEMWWAPHAVRIAKVCGARSAVIVRDEIADLKKAKQYSFSNLDRVITVSEDLKSQLRADVDLYQRTETIYNIVERPIATEEHAEAFNIMAQRYPNVKRWVLSAGTICSRKDQLLLVRALVEMVRLYNDDETGVLFVGGNDSSDYEARLRQVVVDSGLEDRVFFVGQIANIGYALDISAVSVLTSHSEGLPRVLIECALAGLPSISTKVSGVDEVYGSDAERFVLETRNPVELAEKLQGLLDDGVDEVVDAIKSRAQNRFCRQAHCEAWKLFFKLDQPRIS